jgi:hypothetical protein
VAAGFLAAGIVALIAMEERPLRAYVIAPPVAHAPARAAECSQLFRTSGQKSSNDGCSPMLLSMAQIFSAAALSTACVAQMSNFALICAGDIGTCTDPLGSYFDRSSLRPSLRVGRRLLKQVGVFRIDRQRDLAGEGAHCLVMQRLFGECGKHRRAVNERRRDRDR